MIARKDRKILLRFILRHFARDENGGIAIMFALMLPVLFGIIGLGVEAGLWFKERRELQTIADAAAVSAAIENTYGATSAELTAIATLEAGLNGFDATTDTITYVGTPTTATSTYVGNTAYVEVIVTRTLDTILSQVFYTFSPTTTARAIAATSGDSEACVLALSTTASPAIGLSGNGTVSMDGCGLVSNSAAASYSVSVCSNCSLTVDCVSAAGGINDSGSSITTTECDGPVSNANTSDDPFSTYDVPSGISSMTCVTGTAMSGSAMTISTDTVLTEGRYCQGMKITGGNVTLTAGTYVMDSGDFDMTGGTLSGTGVTIILTSTTSAASNTGAMSITGNGDVDIAAPTSADISGTVTGDYTGILVYQDRNANTIASKNNKFTGGTATEFAGAIYTPSNNIDFKGGNDTSAPGCLMLVGQEVGFTGTADIENQCDMYGGNPILYGASPGLVE